MTRRRAIVVAALALATLGLHAVLVRAMAHGHIAHVLLGSGNAAPPLGAAVLAASLVLVRVGAVVIVPGALLAAAASLLAHVLVGPPRGGSDPDLRGQRDGAADGAPDEASDGAGNGTKSGTGTKPGGRGSASSALAVDVGRGMSMDGRGT
jgi:hypothetical protein